MKLPFDELGAMLRSGEAEKALPILEAALKDEGLDARDRARALDLQGKCRFALGQLADGAASFAENCQLMRDPQNGFSAAALIAALNNCAHALTALGRLEEARAAAEEARGKAAEAYGEGSPQHAEALFRLAEPVYRGRDHERARLLLTQAVQIWGENHGQSAALGACLNNLGRVCEELGDFQAGIEWHRQAAELRRKLPNRGDLAFSLGNYGLALAGGGEIASAIESLREAVSVYASLGGEESGDCRAFRANLAALEKAWEEME